MDSVDEALEKVNKDDTTLIPLDLRLRLGENHRDAIGRKIKEFFVDPSKQISLNSTVEVIF